MAEPLQLPCHRAYIYRILQTSIPVYAHVYQYSTSVSHDCKVADLLHHNWHLQDFVARRCHQSRGEGERSLLLSEPFRLRGSVGGKSTGLWHTILHPRGRPILNLTRRLQSCSTLWANFPFKLFRMLTLPRLCKSGFWRRACSEPPRPRSCPKRGLTLAAGARTHRENAC